MSRVALGGSGFSIGETQDEAAAVDTIRTAYDQGVRQFDSARAYATVDDPLHNETLFRRALGGRDDAVIGTKGGHFRVDRETWGVDGSPAALRRDCENSLTALGVDALPLYYLHKPDTGVPFTESVGALHQLRAEGKIVDVGVCNVSAEQLAQALAITPIAVVQNKFSPYQSADRSVLDAAEAAGLRFFAYSPLGGKQDRGRLPGLMPGTVALAAELGVSFQRLVLAWLLAQSPALTVISGARRP
jgi:pyridoxine 4-dehydrogenase